MRWQNVWVVYGKELKDLVRDRKTIISMIIFPLIGFPIMTIGFNRVESTMRSKAKAETTRVMILASENAPALAARIESDKQFEVVPASTDYVRLISEKKIGAAVEFPRELSVPPAARTGEIPKIPIYFYQSESRSRIAVEKLEAVLREARDQMTSSRLESLRLPVQLLKPVEAKAQNVVSEQKVTGSRLGALMPYLIIIFCLVGAMHPAMDLTAGEKERGTLETILVSAVSRGELIVGKFFLVFTSSLFTASIALASLAATMYFAPTKEGQFRTAGEYSVTPAMFLVVLGLVIPMAILFAAALLAIASLAKSYKEAQSYTGPIMIFAILPAITSFIPGIDLNPVLALIPIVNVSLVAKEAFAGTFNWPMIALVFAMTWVYAGIALSIAVLQFQREEVLFRS